MIQSFDFAHQWARRTAIRCPAPASSNSGIWTGRAGCINSTSLVLAHGNPLPSPLLRVRRKNILLHAPGTTTGMTFLTAGALQYLCLSLSPPLPDPSPHAVCVCVSLCVCVSPSVAVSVCVSASHLESPILPAHQTCIYVSLCTQGHLSHNASTSLCVPLPLPLPRPLCLYLCPGGALVQF